MNIVNEEHTGTARADKRRRTEDDLQEQMVVAEHTKLADSNRRLSEGSQTKSDFLAELSHELYTSLNSVIGFSNVLLDRSYGPINEQQQEYIQNIRSSGKHLLSLFNDILSLSRVESGSMELDLGVVSVRELLETSLVILREKSVNEAVVINLDIAPEADLSIVADQRKLKQIMFNLLSNAVKFTPTGGNVDVNARKEGEYIEITVWNGGDGIREEDIPKLFQVVTTTETHCSKEMEGTGMSLALTKQLVELHGGCIRVKSEINIGSSFSFTIPLIQSHQAAHV